MKDILSRSVDVFDKLEVNENDHFNSAGALRDRLSRSGQKTSRTKMASTPK
jgi:hypothetical protein